MMKIFRKIGHLFGCLPPSKNIKILEVKSIICSAKDPYGNSEGDNLINILLILDKYSDFVYFVSEQKKNSEKENKYLQFTTLLNDFFENMKCEEENMSPVDCRNIHIFLKEKWDKKKYNSKMNPLDLMILIFNSLEKGNSTVFMLF